jgi:hypothetical protein
MNMTISYAEDREERGTAREEKKRRVGATGSGAARGLQI